MITTCGIIFQNADDRFLICHPTHAPIINWSIPKGILEPNEKHFETALRELEEETGIKLCEDTGKYLLWYSICTFVEIPDFFVYKNGKKRLKCFYLKSHQRLIDSEELHCNSLVNNSFPEVDQFQFVEFDKAIKLLHSTQIEALMWLKENNRLL